MKKLIVITLLTILASHAAATPTARFLSYTGPHGNGGGQFTVEVTGLAPSPFTIQSFCLEKNEYISVPSPIYNAVVNTGAVKGGKTGQTSTDFDPLDPRTAWLYSHFVDGTLDDNVAGYSETTNASAIALQNAIWTLEGELPNSTPTGLWSDLVSAAANNAPQSIGDVRVLNLYTTDGAHKQDMIIKLDLATVVTSTPTVPSPPGIALASIGALGAFLSKRKLCLA